MHAGWRSKARTPDVSRQPFLRRIPIRMRWPRADRCTQPAQDAPGSHRIGGAQMAYAARTGHDMDGPRAERPAGYSRRGSRNAFASHPISAHPNALRWPFHDRSPRPRRQPYLVREPVQ